MCTLTYFKDRNGSIFITSNRDESHKRPPALMPGIYKRFGIHCLYPKDPQGEGSWFVVTETGICGVILNAADKSYKRNPPYRKSRGLVLLDMCISGKPSVLPTFYNFNGIEPFTAVLFDLLSDKIHEIKWRGDKCLSKTYTFDKPALWASANLFSDAEVKHKEKVFFDQISSAEIHDRESIIKFHRQNESNGGSCENFLDRPLVKTCSIISLIVHKKKLKVAYQDTIRMNNFAESELVLKS
jgi:uncharacterized protein with NRDE domain